MSISEKLLPINGQVMDTLVRASEADWIELSPKNSVKVLYTGGESGCWAVLYRWKKGFVAGQHKHLSGSHTYVLKGRLQVRDGVLEAGDYVYEANGMIHGATTALEDTEYLFISAGPLVGFDDHGLRGYQSWEQFVRLKQGFESRKAAAEREEE
jgi:quercetin dioxygenase-like cupin family protein